MWLSGNEGLDYHVLDVGPYLLGTLVIRPLAVPFNIVKHGPKTAFVPDIVLVGVFIEHEIVAIFVNSVVCEVHA